MAVYFPFPEDVKFGLHFPAENLFQRVKNSYLNWDCSFLPDSPAVSSSVGLRGPQVGWQGSILVDSPLLQIFICFIRKRVCELRAQISDLSDLRNFERSRQQKSGREIKSEDRILNQHWQRDFAGGTYDTCIYICMYITYTLYCWLWIQFMYIVIWTNHNCLAGITFSQACSSTGLFTRHLYWKCCLHDKVLTQPRGTASES